ncbi:hypothetical protein HRW07_22070, partial [Streptomyces lunaelactis]|uniref:DUF5990 family protein n=1 Tax=Streptomyces lunaelactis TaxID=1535768 RepID=UPI001D5A48AE
MSSVAYAPRGLLPPPCICTHRSDISRSAAGRSLIRPDPEDRPYVQGRRGERFVYLTWGELPPGGEFAMFRRAKLFLADLPEQALSGGAVETGLGLTDGAGMPLCAAVRPPLITWRLTG